MSFFLRTGLNPGCEKDIPKLLKIFSKIQLFSFSPIHTASRLIILAYHFASPGMQGLNTPPAKAGGFTVATKVAFRLKPVWPLLKQAEVIPPQFGRFHLHLPVA